ncbi:conjugal transfer protein TrbD [Vibrio sp. 10N.222.54.A1]|uniref:conjugal transfer protein TrbD n=1 Tax=unclassified Vibrio TaxID=2614977 RepID=UPI0010BD9D82|nr:conjugal transfer protein TrbD [Vibrio sp. F13]TKF93332.1 conjugal transfer protein TrbD [Vibrio sp. F13]
MDEDLQFVRVYAFNRAHLVMGGEREIVMVSMLLALVLIMLQNVVTAVMGVVVLFSMLVIARLMAKNDPILTKVYRRYAALQRYYPGQSVKYLHKSPSTMNAR